MFFPLYINFSLSAEGNIIESKSSINFIILREKLNKNHIDLGLALLFLLSGKDSKITSIYYVH